MKHVVLDSASDIVALRHAIVGSATATVARVLGLLETGPALPALAQIRFDRVGVDPLDLARRLNFVEQLNQTFTYLVSLQAAARLFADHPGEAPFELNLGTHPGFDVQSASGSVVAETFAAVDPRNNSKLDKDIERVRDSNARSKYVFFCSELPRYDEWIQQGVTIVPVELKTLLST